MDRYTRGFVLASLVYLVVGGMLGLSIGVAPTLAPLIWFSHAHALLLGFMAMMVFGVGYFILPRFAARSLLWPRMVGVHFWVANVSLPVFLVAKPLGQAGGSAGWTGLFHAAALVQALSLALFSANLGGTLLAAGKPEPAPAAKPAGAAALGMARPPAAPQPALSADTPVGEVVERKQGALELLVEAGLTPLADPQHLAMVRARGVSLGHACSRHGIPLEALLARLAELPDRAQSAVTPATVIGALVQRYPQARDVLERRFGSGCFTCPGFETETLAQGAAMHGVEVDDLIADLRAACLGPGARG